VARVREVIKNAKPIEAEVERKQDFSSISIKIASPETIIKWSHGEVKKPETINYRTYRPEKDGLFDEKIFGPTKDWECYCGKYKRIKYREIVCERCGVQVTSSKVRRERMGHIKLSSPVTHIWFLKSIPSRIGVLLEMTTKDLERVIYYESYIVIDPGTTGLPKRQLLSEENLQKMLRELGEKSFKYNIGAEAIRELLREIDLETLSAELKAEIKDTKSANKKKDSIKRLRIVENFRKSGNKPEWMVLEALPVIPPDLRPLVPLDGSRFASSDLNDLYRRVINRNNRLKRLMDAKAPGIIINNEKRMLQEGVDALFDNGRRGVPVKSNRNKPLKSLADMLKGKQGRFRQNLLGKRVDYSGRSVIVVGPELKLYQAGIPKKMLLELFKPFIIKKLEDKGYVHTVKSARKMVESVKPEVWEILEEVIKDHPVMLNRAPTLHRQGIQGFEIVPIEGSAIRVHPLVCTAFNADFDGDQMAVHVPLSPEAIIECRTLLLSTNNIFATSSGEPLATPSREIVAGIAYMTKLKTKAKGEGKVFSSFQEAVLAYDSGRISLHSRVVVPKKGFAGEKLIEQESEKIEERDKERKIKSKVYIESRKQFGITAETEIPANILVTSVGRIIVFRCLSEGVSFPNKELNKRELSDLVEECFKLYGISGTVGLLDRLKDLGFEYATKSGLTIGIDDMIIPTMKEEYIKHAEKEAEKIADQYTRGIITDTERYHKHIDVWMEATNKVSRSLEEELKNDKEGFNPISIMVHSGSRGNIMQVRQLIGMRGLMAKPLQNITGGKDEIVEYPIKSNFRSGLSVIEYFISTHGGRKGLADTALKTSEAGYLTRRLVDVAQDVIITEDDCGTKNGTRVDKIGTEENHDKALQRFKERIIGRVALFNIADLLTAEIYAKAGEIIDSDKAERIARSDQIDTIMIRSSITCAAKRGICAMCYGENLSTKRIVDIGETVGIIAAQSIGEPGTQLTLRTFHIGGNVDKVAKGEIEVKKEYLEHDGEVSYSNIKFGENSDGEMIIVNRETTLNVNYKVKNRSKTDSYKLPFGTVIYFKEGETFEGRALKEKQKVTHNRIKELEKERNEARDVGGEIANRIKELKKITEEKIIAKWDTINEPILSFVQGRIEYDGLVEGVTYKEEVDKVTKLLTRIVIKNKGEGQQPYIRIIDAKGKVLASYALPEEAHILAKDKDKIKAFDVLGTRRRARGKNSGDITSGLPRVAELFEARKPKELATISEIEGVVQIGEIEKRMRKITVNNNTAKLKNDALEKIGQERKWIESAEYSVPQGKHILVSTGEVVSAGDQLTDGAPDPRDYLMVQGEKATQEYLLEKIQEVYSSQGVKVNDKHIEIIVKQMLRKVKITDPGDTAFLEGQEVDKKIYEEENSKMLKDQKKAHGEPILQGITKASLSTESFFAAASFQETTRVLTDAATSGKVDYLKGLKENIIIGRLIPAGTGSSVYRGIMLENESKKEAAVKEEEEIKEPTK